MAVLPHALRPVNEGYVQRSFGYSDHGRRSYLVIMRKHKTLHVWQRSHELALSVLRATDGSVPPRCWAVFDQLRRAAVSVEANIVEGYALGSRPQFRRHLRIALGSAAETECLIDLAQEAGYLGGEIAGPLRKSVDAALALLHGTLRSPGESS